MRSDRRFLHLWTIAAALSAAVLGETLAPRPAFADIAAVAQRQRTEKKIFTDSEIVEGFLSTAFGAEYHLAGRVDRIRKYDGPVRVFADGTRIDRKAQLSKIVADIAARVQHLDIAMAEAVEGANVQVKLVRDRDLQKTIATFYGSERAREIRSSLEYSADMQHGAAKGFDAQEAAGRRVVEVDLGLVAGRPPACRPAPCRRAPPPPAPWSACRCAEPKRPCPGQCSG